MSKLRICLDPGHAKTANGGVVSGYYESHMVYNLAQYIKTELNKYNDVEVFITKPVLDSNPGLDARGQMAIDNNCNVFLSLHSNAATAAACGVSVFRSIHRPDSDVLGTKLGQAVANVMYPVTKNTYLRSGKTVTKLYPGTTNLDYYAVIRSSVRGDCVKYSYILEHGFHTNYSECSFLNNDANIRKLAEAEVKVLAEYFGLQLKEQPKPVTPTPTPNPDTFEVGDIVNFTGGNNYKTANDLTGSKATAGEAKITVKKLGAKHPYHIIHTTSASTVYGWVDANTISKKITESVAPDTGATVDVCPYKEPTVLVYKNGKNSAEDVKWVQWYLTNAGYPVTVDGAFGSDTDKKVREFQTAQHLSVDGMVGKDTRAALKNPQSKKMNPYQEPTVTLRKGNSGATVKWLQWELKETGYGNNVEIDGMFGSLTESAVKAFQKDSGIAVDGLVGPATRAKLKAFTASNTVTQLPTNVTYSVGDKVIVDGAISAFGSGNGNTIAKKNATMYVCDIVDSKQFKNYIGVSVTKTSGRQGWANPSMLRKA